MDRKILIDIGCLCAEIRKQCGFTQKELGIKFKVPMSQISNFEYGKINNAVLYHKYLQLKNEYGV